jgi:hypothetical protein
MKLARHRILSQILDKNTEKSLILNEDEDENMYRKRQAVLKKNTSHLLSSLRKYKDSKDSLNSSNSNKLNISFQSNLSFLSKMSKKMTDS